MRKFSIKYHIKYDLLLKPKLLVRWYDKKGINICRLLRKLEPLLNDGDEQVDLDNLMNWSK